MDSVCSAAVKGARLQRPLRKLTNQTGFGSYRLLGLVSIVPEPPTPIPAKVHVNVTVDSSTVPSSEGSMLVPPMPVPPLPVPPPPVLPPESSSSSRHPPAAHAQPSHVPEPHPEMPQPSLRIPARLTAHLTSTGERWHQDADCGDIRGRITSRNLPCGNCTVGRLPVLPPDVPVPQRSTFRQRRRRE